MAQKKFKISQKANANGVVKYSSSVITCEETEIDTVLATLEGEYTVYIEHTSGGSDALVTNYNLLERVTFAAEGKANMRGGIYGSNDGLIIKNSISPDDLRDIVIQLHPFEDDSTKKPSATSVRPVINPGAYIAPSA